MIRAATLAIAATLTLGALPAQAQFSDEIIVTGSRIDAGVPGVFLEVQGDFLLSEILVYNDSRNVETRAEEIARTLRALDRAARSNPDIELSLLVDDELVRPFSLDAALEAVGPGGRPESSAVTVLAKTPIPDSIGNSYTLVSRLATFANGVDTAGRTSVIFDSEPQVSVSDPNQHRPALLQRITGEIKAVTSALGPRYGAIVDGLDKEMKFVRGSDLSLIFYIPYSYEVLPGTVSSRDVLAVGDY